MAPLLRWLLGSGRFDDATRTRLEAEGVVVLVEGARGSLTSRNLRAPGRRSNWRKEAVVAGLAITRERVLAVRGRQTMLDAPLGHPALTATVEEPDHLLLTWDCAAFRADTSGTQELRLRTPEAEAITRALHTRR